MKATKHGQGYLKTLVASTENETPWAASERHVGKSTDFTSKVFARELRTVTIAVNI